MHLQLIMKSLFLKLNCWKEDFLRYLQDSPILISLPIILTYKKWPQTNEQLMNFEDHEIKALKVNSCETGNIMFVWDHLVKCWNSFLKNEKD